MIGPEATRTTSGRIVVVAAFYAVLGLLSMVLGAGPFVENADAATRMLAALGLAAGGILVVGAVGLVVGGRWGRRLGVLGGVAAVGIGVLATALALGALGTCQSSAAANACWSILVGIGAVGVLVAAGGVGSVIIVRGGRLGVVRSRR